MNLSILLLLSLLILGSWTAPTVVRLPSQEIVNVHELSHQTASYRLFKLITVSSNELILNITRNDFHHTLNTTCISYTGTIQQQEDTAIIGWTTLSLCNGTLTGLLSIKDTGLYSIQPAADGLPSKSSHHILHKEKSYTTHHCSTTTPTETSTKRLKRHQQVVLEKTIEVALYIDTSLATIHQTNLSSYLLHLMNTVNHLYKDSSIGSGSIVNIALVKWNTTDSNTIGSTVHSSPGQLRDSFCKWQSIENEHSTVHHDVAILLTRDSICETPDCGVLGIANYRSACQKGRSCIVVKDTGLSTAFIIAHELGHSLGMYHDGDRNIPCKSSGYYLMASSFQDSVNPHKWSKCSSQQLYDYLNSPDSSCLNNQPTTLTNPSLSPPPLIGQDYSLNKQCQLLYGSQSATSCHKTNCSMLWCSLSNGGPCINTQHSPPAGGSSCLLSNGSQGLCYHGNCRSHVEVSTPIDGGWGQWSGWSQCSSTCDDGVQYKYRECNSPQAQFGGKRCTGERKIYQICINSKCPPHNDYRNSRCKTLGKERFPVSSLSHEEHNHWMAVDSNDLINYRLDSCSLYCKVSGESSLHLMEKTVPLGVTCTTVHHTPGMCIESKCIQVGCNGTLGAPHYTDQCGVECGNGSSCHKVSFIFTPTQGTHQGYQDVIELPSGVRNIEIDQGVPSHNLIAAYSHSFQLNSVSNRPFRYHSVRFAGTVWNYDHTHLRTTGAINEPVSIKVYVHDTHATGTFNVNYIIQHSDSQWSVGVWSSSCSHWCGNGTLNRNVTCRRSQCDIRTRPPLTKSCFIEPCTNYRWSTGVWSQCSTSCGSGGLKTRSVHCTHINGTIMDEKYCTDTKPVEREICSQEPCGCSDIYSSNICQSILQQGYCIYSYIKANCCKTCQ